MRAGVVLAVEEWAGTMDDAANCSTHVALADGAKASENNDIEKEAADVRAGADKLLASAHLLCREGGARLYPTLENNLMLFISISNY